MAKLADGGNYRFCHCQIPEQYGSDAPEYIRFYVKSMTAAMDGLLISEAIRTTKTVGAAVAPSVSSPFLQVFHGLLCQLYIPLLYWLSCPVPSPGSSPFFPCLSVAHPGPSFSPADCLSHEKLVHESWPPMGPSPFLRRFSVPGRFPPWEVLLLRMVFLP